MSSYNIIIYSIMLLMVVISFYVLSVNIRTDNAIVISSYNNSVKKIRDEKYIYKESKKMTQEDLLENFNYILNCFD